VEGLLALRAGDPATALERSNRAIAAGSLQLESRLVRAAALGALGRFDEARGALDTLRARMPGNPEVESLWGQYLLATGHPADARPVLERAFSLFPEDADVAFALGMACADTRAATEAITAFTRAVEQRPRFYEAWLQLGAAKLQVGDRAGAAQAFDSAMRLPESADGRAAALRRMAGGAR
jgi:predicted Zn-dependent protease